MANIIVDPRFRDKIPKPTPEERRRLEENILADGYVREPLVLWKGHDTLVDGHNRWEIIQAHPELPYRTVEQEFSGEWDVIAWICRNQLGRRNISKVVYDKLIQEEYEAVQKIQGGTGANQYTVKEQSGENLHSAKKTRVIIAEEHGIPEGTVKSAVEFGRGLDAIDAAVPGTKDAVLSGELKVKKSEVAEARKMEPEEIASSMEVQDGKAHFHFPRTDNRGSGRPSELRAIEEMDAAHYGAEDVAEYGLDDLLEDIRALHEDFLDKYHTVMDVHRDIVTDNAKKVLAAMKEFETEWKEIKEILK